MNLDNSNNQSVVIRARPSALATNSVLRNTYFLLSLTLLFSAATAAFAVATGARVGVVVMLVGMFGLLFLVTKLRNSAWGIAATFAFTGFMGYTLGPVLSNVMGSFSNGGHIIATALGGTGTIFLALSAYVLMSRKDFSYMGGFLFAAVTVAFLAGLGGAIFNIPMLQLVVSGAFALISSGLILFHTSQIINGGERNYIMATISLYIALFNLFVSLLSILSVFSGNRN